MNTTTLRTSSLADVAPQAWDALVGGGSPFLEWQVLAAFEGTGCTSGENGWLAQHVLVEEHDTLVAAIPMYVKAHSAGEFVFDHAWAYAAERIQQPYYPKLVVAAPFTPVVGPRMLLGETSEPHRLRAILARGAWEVCTELGMSGLHWLFATPVEAAALEATGYALRAGVQFHWHNRGYEHVDDWLEGFSGKRRRAIRRERRAIAEAGLEIDVLEGARLDERAMHDAYELYLSTIEKKLWGRQYLDRAFFVRLGERARERLLFVVARRAGKVIAGALYVHKQGALYGRYWGCHEDVPFLHFELCCYQPVQICIERRWDRFDAGAQGEHKYDRGFDPVVTWSAHRLANAPLDRAIRRFVAAERRAVERQLEAMIARSPCQRVREEPVTSALATLPSAIDAT